MITEYAKMYRCSRRRRNSGTSFLCAWAKVPDFIFLKKYCIIFIESKEKLLSKKIYKGGQNNAHNCTELEGCSDSPGTGKDQFSGNQKRDLASRGPRSGCSCLLTISISRIQCERFQACPFARSNQSCDWHAAFNLYRPVQETD